MTVMTIGTSLYGDSMRIVTSGDKPPGLPLGKRGLCLVLSKGPCHQNSRILAKIGSQRQGGPTRTSADASVPRSVRRVFPDHLITQGQITIFAKSLFSLKITIFSKLPFSHNKYVLTILTHNTIFSPGPIPPSLPPLSTQRDHCLPRNGETASADSRIPSHRWPVPTPAPPAAVTSTRQCRAPSSPHRGRHTRRCARPERKARAGPANSANPQEMWSLLRT